MNLALVVVWLRALIKPVLRRFRVGKRRAFQESGIPSGSKRTRPIPPRPRGWGVPCSARKHAENTQHVGKEEQELSSSRNEPETVPKLPRIRIKGDGTYHGTRVSGCRDGVFIDFVRCTSYRLEALPDGSIRAEITHRGNGKEPGVDEVVRFRPSRILIEGEPEAEA